MAKQKQKQKQLRKAKNAITSGSVPDSEKPTPFAAFFVAAVGLYPLAIGLKFLPVPPHSLHCPYWVMTAVGCATFFAGIAIGLQCLGIVKSLLYKFVVTIVVISMLVPAAWLVFGDNGISLFFKIAFASPFAIIFLLLIPGGKTKIVPNPGGKSLKELLHEGRLESSNLQEIKWAADKAKDARESETETETEK